MTERGRALHATADGQIAELIALISTVDEAALRLSCPGRERLGDGTVGASVRHTTDNYQRIAAFVQTSDQMSGAHRPPGTGAIASLGSPRDRPGAPQTTPDTAPAPVNKRTSTQPTPSISPP